MASLMQIAKEQAENLRAGIVWVIVWKTGRSWHAEAVSLNQTTRTWGSMEDKKRASAIMQEDPQAVVCSGDICGLSGKKYALQGIAEQIRWQYEYSAASLCYILHILAVPKVETAAGKRVGNHAAVLVDTRGSSRWGTFDWNNWNRPPPEDRKPETNGAERRRKNVYYSAVWRTHRY